MIDTKNGIADAVQEPTQFPSPKDMELVPFLEEGDILGGPLISGEELSRRAENLGALMGREKAMLIMSRRHEIPEEFRSYFLLFPEQGNHLVASLIWNVNRQCFLFCWLEGGFLSDCRLLRSRSGSPK